MGESTVLENHRVDEFGVQTHYLENDAHEVVLIGVDVEALGSDNSYPPPNPFESSVETWMRKGYFHNGGRAIAQFPRQTTAVDSSLVKTQLEHVCWDENTITAYYPSEDAEAYALVWDYSVDSWSLDVVSFDSYFDEVESHHECVLWENRRNL